MGCRTFFVAHLEEGLELRKAIGLSSRIFVLNGTPPGTEGEFLEAVLIPVANTKGELAGWHWHASEKGRSMPVALQIDTGMLRLGLSPGDVAMLAIDPTLLDGLSVDLPREGEFVDVICPRQTVDDIAGAAGTIGYEIRTRLGRRFNRDDRRHAALVA